MSSPIIILTGASRGLGLATIRILLERYNARVTAVSRSCPAELQEVQRANADRVELIKGDVGSIKLNEEVVKRTVARWGGIDGLIINAGSLEPVGKSTTNWLLATTEELMWAGRIADIPLDQLSTYTESNMHAALYLIQPSLPYLRKSKLDSSSDIAGRIVLTSSGASQTGYPGWGFYCMAKSGLNALARVLAAEEKEHGVAVWAVRPGVINVSLYVRTWLLDPASTCSVTACHTMHSDNLLFQGILADCQTDVRFSGSPIDRP